MEQELRDAWRTNQAINAMIIDAVSDDGWTCTLSKRGGRGVAGEFAHIHNIRCWHLEKRAKDLATNLTRYERGVTPSKDDVRSALESSSDAIEQFLVDACNNVPKRRTFRKGLATSLAYLVSHEAHHRGRILLTLKVSGETIDKNVAMGIWGWDQIET